MDAKLKKFLDANKIKYKLEEHKKVYTAFNEAETQHLKPKEVAKTVLVKADKGFAIAVVPAQKKVDFNKVKKALKAKQVSMAREGDMAKILKTKIGLAHPFGNLYKLPTLVDNSLLKQKNIIASAGSYTESIEFKTADFVKLVQSVKGSFLK
ncbi:MAG: YbaK/EbsC family protein [Candidatus Doudnabacteria bacterium]|nr:YbaK/EbsC family protein [Candidatus Doudnabacteria bacterium]